MPLHDNFCRNVKKRRLELGLTQLELADRLGVSRPYIAEIESGRRTPGLELVERVAKALDCPALNLLTTLEAVASH